MDDTLEIIKEAQQLREMEGKAPEAIEMLKELGEEIKDDPLLSYDYPRILKNIGIYYSDLGQNEKAKEYFKKALEVAKQDLNKMETAEIRTCIASLELNTGNIEKAMKYVLRAWEYIGVKRGEKFGITKANTSIVLGDIYFEQGKYSEAIDRYKGALEYSTKVDYLKGVIIATERMAKYYTMREEYEKAYELLEEKIQKVEENLARFLPSYLLALARIHLEREEVDEAKDPALKAYKFAKKRDILKLIAESSQVLGRVYSEKNQARADAYFKEAFDSYNKGGYNMPTEHPKEESWFTSFD